MNLHKPRKRFGQHFLCDTEVIQKIVSLLNLKKDDHLIEIGPGLGALTHFLLPEVNTLEVVELDRDLAKILEEKYGQSKSNKLIIHNIDILKVDLKQLVKEKPLRIIGNLPYNISTPLIFHLFKYIAYIKDMHFMLQKEVVERMTAEPNSKDYGRLTIMTQYFCQAVSLFEVDKNAFKPPPKVQSAVIRLLPYQTPPYLVTDFTLFQEIVTAAFNQRRKTIANGLKNFLESDDFESLKIDPKKRPENLTLKDYVEITNFLGTKSF